MILECGIPDEWLPVELEGGNPIAERLLGACRRRENGGADFLESHARLGRRCGEVRPDLRLRVVFRHHGIPLTGKGIARVSPGGKAYQRASSIRRSSRTWDSCASVSRRNAGRSAAGQARDHRFIELSSRQRLWERALAIEYTHDMLGDKGLKRHRPSCTRLLEVVDAPSGRNQPKERLIEAEDAFNRAVGDVVHGEEGMFLAPGARAVRPDACEGRWTVAALLDLNEHDSPLRECIGDVRVARLRS